MSPLNVQASTEFKERAGSAGFWLFYLLLLAGVAFAFAFFHPVLLTGVIFIICVSAIMLMKVENSIYLLMALLPFMDMYNLPIFGVHLKLSDWVMLLAIPAFLFHIYIIRRNDPVPSNPLVIPLVMFTCIATISMLINYDRLPQLAHMIRAEGMNSVNMRSATQVFWGVYSAIIFWTVSRMIRNRKITMGAVVAFIVGISISAIYGISGQRYWLSPSSSDFRVLGTFSEPSYFAEYLILGISLVLPLLLVCERVLYRVLLLGVLGLLLLNLLLTFSTGGFIAALVTLPVLIIMSFKYLPKSHRYKPLVLKWIVLPAMLVAVGVAMFEPSASRQLSEVVQKVTDPSKSAHSAMIRWRLRESAAKMFTDYPVLGVGPGNFCFYRQNYYDTADAQPYEVLFMWDPNNLYLEELCQTGVVGFIFFAWVWIAVFKFLLKGLRSNADEVFKAIMVGCFAALLSLMVNFLAHGNWYRIYVWALYALAVATVNVAMRGSSGEWRVESEEPGCACR